MMNTRQTAQIIPPVDSVFPFYYFRPMKNILFISALVLGMSACSNNPNTEAVEQAQRDSLDQAQQSVNQRFVDSLEKAEMLKEMQGEHDHTHGSGDTAHHEH